MKRAWTKHPEFAGGALEKGAAESLADSGGRDVRIACARGCLWITREDDREDYFLRAGETDIFAGRGRIVLEALEDATVTVESRRARGRLRVGLENLREIFREWKRTGL